MKWPRLRVSLLCCLLLSGCMPQEIPDLVPLPAPATAAASPPAGALQAALLTAADLPAGFVHFDYFEQPTSGATGCAGDFDPPKPDAVTQFRRGETGPFVHTTLTRLSVADATAQMQAARRFTEQCPSYTLRDMNGTLMTIRITTGSITGLGDETVATRFTTTADGYPPFLSDQVLVRRGGLLILLAHNAFYQLDTAVTAAAVRAAVTRAERIP
ncbi:hypothetical protein [Catellatospora sichuanensis]|uniref:hypothetical protein n=1 Tax=Catellatospora sichuanensis TaxID=1969805 RepID=UPI0011843B17|nr:hypothetical protein [Catellatospora sichuanensis]